MKRLRFVVFGALLLAVLWVLPQRATLAAADVKCVSDPAVGPIGTVFHFDCTGYDPNANLYAYYVEPDGEANQIGPLKSDEHGQISFAQASKFGTDSALALGTWHIVIEQTGLAKSVIHRGEAIFKITGGSEGVSGAKLWTDPTTTVQDVKFHSVILYGSGFAPFETVTVWTEVPNGDCSSFTQHDEPGMNEPIFNGLSTFFDFDIKTDAAGAFSVQLGNPFPDNCQGNYRFVGRGNTSHRGGETFIRVVGQAVHVNASLDASPKVAVALAGLITFHGSSFASGEHVSCWLTNAEGVTTIFAFESGSDIHASASGEVSFTMHTGSNYPDFKASEGMLGDWWMTCRGDTSGKTAIAAFRLTGGFVDP